MNKEKSVDENQPSTTHQEVQTSVKERVEQQIQAIHDLAVTIGGETATVETVFELPPSVRDEAPMPNWNEEQVARAREVGQSFGYGAERDVLSGLSGGVRIAEGGKVWKIMAEAEAIKKEDQPRRVVFAGSPHRKLGEDELTFLREKHGLDLPAETTEYDAARWVAQNYSDTVADQPENLAFGYSVAEANPMVRETTGQLIKVGQTNGGQDVILLRVDREFYEEDGTPKYRYQPGTDRLLGFMAEVMDAEGDNDSPVALATSNTYASRQTEAIKLGLTHGRPFGVIMYGRETLHGIGAPVPAELPLNHLPGDLRVLHDNLQKLKQELDTHS